MSSSRLAVAALAILPFVGLPAFGSTAQVVNVWADDPTMLDVQVVHPDNTTSDVKEGQDLGEADRFRTGYKSHARLDFGGKATVVIDELSEFKVATFKLGAASKVELWLKSGEIEAQVRREAAAKTEFTVRGATATASVRGTKIHSIMYTPERGMMIAMGSEGSLHARPRGGPVLSLGPDERAREDEQGRPLIDDAHIRLDESRSLVAPFGLTRDEQLVTTLNPLQTSTGINIAASGSALGPLPPTGTVAASEVLYFEPFIFATDPGFFQQAGLSVVFTTTASTLGGPLGQYGEIIVNGNASAFTSQLQAFHDMNRGVVFGATGAQATFGANAPGYVGGGLIYSPFTAPATVTAAGGAFTNGAVPAGTVVAAGNALALSGSTGTELTQTADFGSTAVFLANGKGRGAFVNLNYTANAQTSALLTAIVRRADGLP